MSRKESQLITLASVLLVAAFLGCCLQMASAGRRQGRKLLKCSNEECNMKPQHYALYANIKQALDSNFDIKGKQLYPLLNSIEILRRRYDGSDSSLNSSKLVQDLLQDKELERALKIIQSPAGRSLADLYRSPMNAGEQSLSCGKLRLEDIERAARQLEADKELASVFSNIHRNFAAKSARKCLKKACNSVDLSMTRPDAILYSKMRRGSSSDDSDSDHSPATRHNEIHAAGSQQREFESQELKLCRFFKRTNESECDITVSDLTQLSFSGSNKVSPLDLVQATQRPASNTEKEGDSASPMTGQQATQLILAECRPLRSLLDFNLAALKWYNKTGLFDKSKFSSRVAACPRLAYWLEMDRLCGELESLATESTSGASTLVY